MGLWQSDGTVGRGDLLDEGNAAVRSRTCRRFGVSLRWHSSEQNDFSAVSFRSTSRE